MARALPTFEDWQAAADSLGLKRRGRELAGPCPVCGGVDRFHVGRARDGGAIVGCRGCMDGEPDDVKNKAFKAVLDAAFPFRDRFANGRETRKVVDRQPSVSAAAALWATASHWHGTLAEVYLEGRGVNAWRFEDGAEPCRWADVETATPALRGLRWKLPPSDCAGLLLWPFTDSQGEVRAAQFEALTAAGGRTGERWRRTLGGTGGAWHRCGAGFDGELHLCEGPVDALAVASVERVEAWAAGSAANLGAKRAGELAALGRPIVLRPDGDPAGRKAAAALLWALWAKGGNCRIQWCAEGRDPASELLQ